MTYLTVYTDADTPETLLETEDLDEVDAALKEIDVRLRHWEVIEELTGGATQEDVLSAYRAEVDKVVAEEGYVFVDVTQLHPEDGSEWAEKAAAAAGTTSAPGRSATSTASTSTITERSEGS